MLACDLRYYPPGLGLWLGLAADHLINEKATLVFHSFMPARFLFERFLRYNLD